MMMLCLPDASARHTTYYDYPKIKMERDTHDDQQDRSRSPSQPGIPIATVMTANENWRGKNDPAERRRIQNRLNQRAFRQRQRAGESPKQYKPRSMSSPSQQHDSSDDADSPGSGSSHPTSSAGARTASDPTADSTSTPSNPQAGRVWDELARLISRNFTSATITNARHLNLDPSALQSGTAMKTPRPTPGQEIPASLTPVEAQYQIPHDPIIDTLPHARLRFNILRAIANGAIEAAAFSKCIRGSGAMELLGGSWQRGGVVVWSFPEQVGSWELSEAFVRRWAVVLEGCEDLIAATNAWRGRRGERLFPLTIRRSEDV